jgi:hypothetical protein
MSDTWKQPQDFRLWWIELNEFLASHGEGEAAFGDARYWHDAGYSPAGSAGMIAAERSENAA